MMENNYQDMKPSYFTVIPAYVRYNKNLSFFDIVLFGEIVALSNMLGYCYATNKYFEDLFGLSEMTIRRSISTMVKLGILSISIDQAKGNERRIMIDPGRDNSKCTPGLNSEPTPGLKTAPPILLSNSILSPDMNNLNLNNCIRPLRSSRKAKDERPDVVIPWLAEYMRTIQ